MLFTFRFRQAVATTALLGLVCTAPAHADTTVVNQVTNLNGSDSSQNDTKPGGSGNFATTYDNFLLGSNAQIIKATWVGDYFTGNPGTITGFTLNFYDDIAGQPGTLLQSESIVGNANETAIGIDTFFNPVFSYSATLPTTFGAAGGNQYWMSIVADLVYEPNWGWELGTGGDSSSYQDYYTFHGAVGNDLAFSLIATDVTTPEPGSVGLLVGMGVTGLACFRRRRLARKAA